MYILSSRNTKVIDYDKAFGSIPRALPLYYLRRGPIVYIIKEIRGLVALIAEARDSAGCMLAVLSSCVSVAGRNSMRMVNGGKMVEAG